MDWFERLTGFKEESPQQLRNNLVVEGDRIKSLINDESFVAGKLETPSLGELRQRIRNTNLANEEWLCSSLTSGINSNFSET